MEVGFEPTEGLPLHTLSRTGRGRRQLFRTGLSRAEGLAEVADERLRTGVNETKTETTRGAIAGRAEQPSGMTWPPSLTRRPRTQRRLHATRLPTLLTCVHPLARPSSTCADAPRAAVGERLRTGMNETIIETRAGDESSSLRMLSVRGTGRHGLPGFDGRRIARVIPVALSLRPWWLLLRPPRRPGGSPEYRPWRRACRP